MPAERRALMLAAHPPGRGTGSGVRGLVTLRALEDMYDRVDVVALTAESERAFAEPGAHLIERPPEPSRTAQIAALARGSAHYHAERAAGLPERVRGLVTEGALRSRYDLVWCHSSLMARAGRAVEAGRRVLDIDNVAEAATRELAAGPGMSGARGAFWRLAAAAVGREERRRCDWHDAVTVTSEGERVALGAVRPPVTVLPNTVASPGEPARPGETGPRVLFVGSLDYEPNVDAVLWLADEVAPALRARVTGVEFAVVGRGPTPEVAEACARAGFELVADAPDLGVHYRAARVVIAPTRMGGGTGRIKVIEAMAFGAALVSTPQGLLGLDVAAGREVEVADSAPELARVTAELLEDPARAAELGARAREAWRTRRSPERAAQIVRDVVEGTPS